MALSVKQFMDKYYCCPDRDEEKMKADLEEMLRDAASKEGMRIIQSRMANERAEHLFKATQTNKKADS